MEITARTRRLRYLQTRLDELMVKYRTVRNLQQRDGIQYEISVIRKELLKLRDEE